MKILAGVLVLMAVAGACLADEYVRGYTRRDGTYVNGYTRSSPDSSYNNNYSTSPNINPYTGTRGTNSPTYNDRTPDYNMQTYGNSGTYSRKDYSNTYNSGSQRPLYQGY